MFFTGSYSHSLDEKCRVILPSKLREKLGSSVYISLGLDKCLAVYPVETFENKVNDFSKQSTLNSNVRNFMRTFFANSFQCDIDKQGRIQLSKESLDKCLIKKDVVILGNFDHVEIWDKDKYSEFSKVSEEEYESNASKMYLGE